MRLHHETRTWVSVTVAAISLGVNTNHIGNIGAFDIDAVEHLLTDVVEFIGEDSALDTKCLVRLLSNYFVSDFSEPPDTWIDWNLPLRCH